MVILTTLTGTMAYAVALTCGRPFAVCFALLAAVAVPVIAFH